MSKQSEMLILALKPGDALIVQLSTDPPNEQYVNDVKEAIRRQLRFDVPIIVTGPGVKFEIARPPRCSVHYVAEPCPVCTQR